MKCSACGQRGHMKTNRSCPEFNNRTVKVAPTDQELEQHEAELSSQTDIVKVEGTKVILNRAVVEKVAEFRRKSLLLKFPKDAMRKRRRGPQDEDLDYLETRKSVQRRKTNPEVCVPYYSESDNFFIFYFMLSVNVLVVSAFLFPRFLSQTT